MANKFSSSEAINFGWKTAKANIRFFAPVLVLSFVIPSIFNSATSQVQGTILDPVFTLVGLFIDAVLTLGMIRISLMFVDGKKPTYHDFFFFATEPILTLKYLASFIVYYMMVGVGLLLLIIPGVYWSIKYGFYAYLMVDKNSGIGESFRKSKDLTQGIKLSILWFGLRLGLITLAGLLVFVVGLFWAAPTVSVALAHVYRQLNSKS